MIKNIRTITISVLAATNLLLSACVDVKDAEQVKNQADSAKQSGSTTFSYIIPDSEDPNHFEVHLRFPAKNYTLLRKTILQNEDPTSINNKPADYRQTANSGFIDYKVIAGADYLYSIGTYDEENIFREEDRLKVSIPVDIELEPNSQLVIDRNNLKQISNLLRIRRLTFSEGSELITNGQDLVIKAEKLISFKGKIRSFNAQAPLETNGADAGTLTLFAKNAEGELEVHLDGQQGGNGSPGRNAVNYNIPSTRGTPGKNGGAGGEIRYSFISHERFVIDPKARAGAKGTGGAGGAGAKWLPQCPKTHDGGCDRVEESTPASPNGDDGVDGPGGRVCEAIKNKEDSMMDGNNYNCHPSN